MAIDPKTYSIEIFGLSKRFLKREGLPSGWKMGDGHWVVSSIIKMLKKPILFNAVNDINLKVKKGDILGLLGSNGAGKTTLLKCLSTLLRIDEGNAYINGYSVKDQTNEVKLSINLVGSGHWVGFDWGMTLEQNLDFFGGLYGLDRSERQVRIDHVLNEFDMAKHKFETPQQLSTGERQRLLLAKGFMIKSPVIFLDEPTVGLDAEGAYQVRQLLIEKIMSNSTTSGILTTHRLQEAEALCNQIAIMKSGTIIACGTQAQIKDQAGRNSVIIITTSNISQSIIKYIRNIPGIYSITKKPSDSKNRKYILRINCDNIEKNMSRIIDTITSRGYKVFDAKISKSNLEDAYIKLTNMTNT